MGKDEIFDGVILVYEVNIPSKPAKIISGLIPHIRVTVKTNLLLFSPEPSMPLEGKVVRLGRESIHVVMLGFFSAAIMFEDIREDLKYKIVRSLSAIIIGCSPPTSLPPAGWPPIDCITAGYNKLAVASISKELLVIKKGVSNILDSCHNHAIVQFESFQDQRHSVSNILRAHGRDIEVSYRTRLTAMLDVTRFLLKQGLSFRGHDESSNSLNRGNFLELLQWYSQRNEEISKVVNQNAPGNNQMISPTIQKDLTRASASEITLSIIKDIGNNVFSLMVDESRDISVKEQMGVVLRYVNKRGQVIERFLAIVHVSDTSSRSLKDAIDALFVKHGLSLSRLRGQGYNGASNMLGEFNGLKSLILQENPYAREEGWHIIIDKVNTFCELNDILVSEMKDNCLIGGRSRRRKQVITNLHYYRAEIFYQVIDLVIQEMNTRFSEVSTELLSCIKLVRLCDLYPEDFSTNDCIVIEQQLQNFIHNIQQDPNFSGIEDLGSFAQKIVETLKIKLIHWFIV
ncbi:uncharacterized protein LOC122019319 [Zingiber officinale]|uniref:uncharacterized protein LOC122019319 n=1 Tax=Zingiber officinale TaxID=94328 RepID=UPI001C4DAB94|nr:uncharacterized protein LOC122019319 [Zingiber officinale]